MDLCIVDYSVEIPTGCSFVIEFIIPKFFLKAHHVSSGTPLIIGSSKLYLQPLVYMPIWWPAFAKAEWAQPWQRPVAIRGYKSEAANTVWNSRWRAVCRSKHVEPLKKLWNNKFYYKAAPCWYFYWVSTVTLQLPSLNGAEGRVRKALKLVVWSLLLYHSP